MWKVNYGTIGLRTIVTKVFSVVVFPREIPSICQKKISVMLNICMLVIFLVIFLKLIVVMHIAQLYI